MLLEDVSTVYEVSIQWTMRAEECRRVSRSVSRIYKVFQQQKKEVKIIDITNFFFTMLLVEVTTVFEGSTQWKMSAEECRRLSRSVPRIAKDIQL